MVFPRCAVVCSDGDRGLLVCVSLLSEEKSVDVILSSWAVVCSNGVDGLLVFTSLTIVGKSRLFDVV